ncbi:hypothetical protein EDC01DRAFT_495201 [Geopyxis carbonaria]|nr:hypothetical protein EDC01DRAFT_495201 [Geopyxis carbonaria]
MSLTITATSPLFFLPSSFSKALQARGMGGTAVAARERGVLVVVCSSSITSSRQLTSEIRPSSPHSLPITKSQRSRARAGGSTSKRLNRQQKKSVRACLPSPSPPRPATTGTKRHFWTLQEQLTLCNDTLIRMQSAAHDPHMRHKADLRYTHKCKISEENQEPYIIKHTQACGNKKNGKMSRWQRKGGKEKN